MKFGHFLVKRPSAFPVTIKLCKGSLTALEDRGGQSWGRKPPPGSGATAPLPWWVITDNIQFPWLNVENNNHNAPVQRIIKYLWPGFACMNCLLLANITIEFKTSSTYTASCFRVAFKAEVRWCELIYSKSFYLDCCAKNYLGGASRFYGLRRPYF